MEIDRGRIYFNAVLGGIGGLVGWALATALAALFSGLNVYARDALLGLGVGLAIGTAIGSTDGLVASRSLRRLRQGMAYGAALGALGGVVGLVLGEVIFGLAGGGVWPRAVGWATFGALVGTSDGFAWRMPARIRYGILGGLLGGLVGGSTYERLVVTLIGRSGNRALALAWGGAVGLIIVGACIGALVGLVESLLRKAWLRFLNGRLEGQTRTLDPSQPRTTLGRSDLCDIVLPGAAGVAATHAEIARDGGDFVLRPRDGAVVVHRDGKLQPGPPYPLRPGDRLEVGPVRITFHTEEGKQP